MANCPFENTDTLDPRRPVPRRERLEPKWENLRTDKASPNRAKDLTLALLPRVRQSSAETRPLPQGVLKRLDVPLHTEKELPRRAHARTDSVLAKFLHESLTLNVDPRRRKVLKLREEPSVQHVTADKPLPARAQKPSVSEKADPILATFRKLSVEPRWTNSRTDMDEPNRPQLRTLQVLEKLTQSKILNFWSPVHT
jgi:hypothetical protein